VGDDVRSSSIYNANHDFLDLDICDGARPKIMEGKMPEYVELMERCWSEDPNERNC
jgi:hypothetical protein